MSKTYINFECFYRESDSDLSYKPGDGSDDTSTSNGTAESSLEQSQNTAVKVKYCSITVLEYFLNIEIVATCMYLPTPLSLSQ